jgi:hypothetical protein
MFFCRWTFGKANFREQKILIFSKGFKVDTLFLHNQLVKLKATLPKNFFGQGNFFGDWYDNQPDEQSIWFTQVYAEKDKLGNFKAFSAFTITFEGTNARDDNQRADPKIKNIEFIFDKERLLLLAGKLKSLSPI